MRIDRVGLLAACCAWLALSATPAAAQTLLDTTELVATSAAPAGEQAEPIAFTVTTAGTYELVVADGAFPAPVQSLRAIVVRDGVVVAQVDVGAEGEQSDSFSATPGDYRIHVLGVPGDGEEAGSFSVRIAPVVGGVNLIDTSASFQGPAPSEETVFTELVPLSITAPGSYELRITDLQLPNALKPIQATIVRNGSPVLGNTSAFPAQFTAATAGEYMLAIVSELNNADEAGLFTVHVEGAGTIPHDAVHTVGQALALTPVTFAAPGQYTMTVADTEFPQSLTSFRTLLVQGGQILANSTDALSAPPFMASAGLAQLCVQITPVASIGVGAVWVRIADASDNTVHAGIRIADADADPSTPSIYAASSPSLAAGTYRVRVEDFGTPSNLSSLRTAVTQGDSILEERIGEGQFSFDTSGGPVRLLIAATPSAATANGLFGLQLEPQAGGPAIIETNQGVGGLFRGHTLTVSNSARYDVTLTDLRFPSELRSSMLILTRGTENLGQVFGGGLLRQQLEPGTYRLNFMGTPDEDETYGAYALKVSSSPPLPTVTLSANPASVVTGGTTTLQWSATNATSCSASGGWSGNQQVSGSLVTAALSAPTTYELECSGPGGSSKSSLTVQVTSKKRKGGGGSADPALLLALGVLCLLAAARRRSAGVSAAALSISGHAAIVAEGTPPACPYRARM